MTLNTGVFDVSDPLNPDRVYSAALLCRMMAKQIRDGIVHEDGNEMAVTVTDPPAMTVLVGTGTAMVQGRFCENDAALTLAVPTAHATYPRIDRVVVRLNASPGRTIDIVVKPGTAAPTPAAPALTRTAETWELSLAQVAVAAGATYVVAGNIIDERGDASLCGVACPVYVPSSQLEVVGAVDMQGATLTGLPAPSGSADAARKGYVDSELAAKIAGFGISQIAIDADKNWGGKSITNIGTLGATQINGNIGATKFSAAASDAVILSRSKTGLYGSDSSIITLIVCTMPAGLQSNSTLRLTLTSDRPDGGLRALVNDAQVFDSTTVKSYDCPVQPGDVVTVQLHGGLIGYGTTNVTGYVRGTLTPIVDVIANWSAQYP